MDRKEIDRLLHKYYAGETSLEEESLLRDYFTSGEEIPADLAAEKEIFGLYSGMSGDGLSENELESMLDSLDTTSEVRSINLFTRRNLYRITALAASLAIIVGAYFGYVSIKNNSKQVAITDTYKGNPELAYNETKRVLLFVSRQFNKGTSELSAVSTINEPVNQLKTLRSMDNSLDKLEYLDGLKHKNNNKGN